MSKYYEDYKATHGNNHTLHESLAIQGGEVRSEMLGNMKLLSVAVTHKFVEISVC